jgi:cytochrome c553
MRIRRVAFLLIAAVSANMRRAVGAESSAGVPTPEVLGISFVPGSTTSVRMERDSRTYEIDLLAKTVREVDSSPAATKSSSVTGASSSSSLPGQSEGPTIFARNCATCHGGGGKGVAGLRTPDFTNPKTLASLKDEQLVTTIEHGKAGTMMPAWAGKLSAEQILLVAAYLLSLSPAGPQTPVIPQTAGTRRYAEVYEPGDDSLFTLPTGRRLEARGVYVNFAHRFAFDPAFSGVARGAALLGIDGFALPSFGFRYGVTERFSVSIYRSPTFISRPIQMMGAYNFLTESDGSPLNVVGRFSIEGQNNFDRNFAKNFEVILSRSLGRRVQIYLIPTVSLGARHLFSPSSFRSSAIPTLPGYDTLSLGVGASFDIRPTVALIVEVIPTLLNGAPLGIHRPAYSFGIQKKIWRHAFTFGFTNSPATTVSQRAATRAAFLKDSEADKPQGLFIGFDLTRQLHGE